MTSVSGKFVLLLIVVMLAGCTTSSSSVSVPASQETAGPVTTSAESDTSGPLEPESEPAFATFEPRPAVSTRLDYSVWDTALQAMVFQMGQSLRKRSSSPQPMVGSRLSDGHDSPYRLEGNKITFSQLDRGFTKALRDYADDLERIANTIDIPSLPRNEQLAFWLNLHNAEMIAQIAEQYPVKNPGQITIPGSDLPLNDAPVFRIDGKDLSLRNVREDIVYTYWQDAVVIYGFWRGTLGGPSIQAEAYTSENLQLLLRVSANEFVNSLRGVREGDNVISVSAIYYEAAPFYFPDFDADLKNHLALYARSDVRDLLASYSAFEMAPFEERIADLAGGTTRSSMSQVIDATTGRQVGVGGVPESAKRMLREFEAKVDTARRQGLLRGTVTVIDGDTEDPDAEVE